MSLSTFSHHSTLVSSGAHIASYYRQTPHGGSLPVLILLHGFPQNKLMWNRFVDEIPKEWSIFIPDLPGYGDSTKEPSLSGDSLSHSKREWAKDIVEALDSVHRSSAKIIAYGHDRGARLSYRMALDFPQRVVGFAVLDIVPTPFVWDAMKLDNEHAETKTSWHWVFLSSPRPIPETLIAAQPQWFYAKFFRRLTHMDGADPAPDLISNAVDPYTDPVHGKARVIGCCEDYRAGATYDIRNDIASGVDPSRPARVFKVPVLVLSSAQLRRRFPVDEIWESLAPEGLVKSYPIGGNGSGHYFPNENQAEVGQRSREWLKTNWGA